MRVSSLPIGALLLAALACGDLPEVVTRLLNEFNLTTLLIDDDDLAGAPLETPSCSSS